ncbi:TPA: hypothetical protein OZ223_004232 [Escherichia coli]|nr:hypothetical protein [Escherichia coli]EFA6296205.1 hypothetical protein [Escherichia coli]EFB9532654.1 hypothetical protein [Escherichia coli]EFD4095447.1 hypothetical protein [Escherichia coli]EFD5433804.1 hypothetical protein [Escherichia coli]
MLSIIFYTFTFSYFDDAKEHNIIMADYHYLYEASVKTKRHKAVLTGERSLEVVDNDNGSNGSEKKLKNKKMLICINNAEDKNYYYYENYILSAYPFKYNNIGNEILYMTGKKLPQSCQESTNRYILYR